jgi:hypothetical protein
MSWAARLICGATLAAGTVSAVTGFTGDWTIGRPSGWLLLGHLAAAPVVMAGVTLMALLHAGRHRYAAGDPAMVRARKTAFWFALLLAWISMTSMLAAMTPVFGYVGQDRLTVAHELSGMGLVVVTASYGAASLAARRRP